VVFASDWGQETGTSSCDKWDTWLGAGDPYIIDLGDIVSNNISGCISLGGSPLENAKVILKQRRNIIQTTTTDANGCCTFKNVFSNKRLKVIIKGSKVDSPGSGVFGCIELNGSPLVNKGVILRQKGEPRQTTTTDADGCYEFGNVAPGKRFRVIIRGLKME
jgi:hypothetical protein